MSFHPRFSFLLAAMACVLLWGTSRAGAAIVYDISSIAGTPNGYTVSGQIETDGKIGLLNSTDVVSWKYTISSVAGSYSNSGTSSSVVLSNIAAIAASPGQIDLLAPSPEGATIFILGVGTPSNLEVIESYDNANQYNFTSIAFAPNQSWYDYGVANVGTRTLATDPPAPEPSAAVFLLRGLFGSGLGYLGIRRRRNNCLLPIRHS